MFVVLPNMKTDIKSKADIHQLMDAFYAKATKDEVIGDKFDHIEMSEHLPRIVEFWSTVILHEGDYKGSPFDKHIPLQLEAQDFERWLFLFEETATSLFEGPTLNTIVSRAKVIGATFQYKIESLQG